MHMFNRATFKEGGGSYLGLAVEDNKYVWCDVCYTHIVAHDINSRNLPNGINGRDYASHTSSESSKSLDFKSN